MTRGFPRESRGSVQGTRLGLGSSGPTSTPLRSAKSTGPVTTPSLCAATDARARAALRWGLRPRMVAGRPFSQKMGRRWLWLLVEQGSWWVTTHPLRSRTNQDLIIACLSRAKCLLYNPIYIYNVFPKLEAKRLRLWKNMVYIEHMFATLGRHL